MCSEANAAAIRKSSGASFAPLWFGIPKDCTLGAEKGEWEVDPGC